MKDHELRELINDVTAVAQIYAHTQQLREQVAQLITPAIAAMRAEHIRLQNINHVSHQEDLRKLAAARDEEK